MDTAVQTLREMITQRGYKITESNEEHSIGINATGHKIVIFAKHVQKFNVDKIKEYIHTLSSMNMNHCIIIYTDSVTSMTKKLVENSIDIKIELFTEEELLYNITKHRLVPEHILLSSEEGKVFKKKYGSKHPAILRTDPICRFYDYQRGDVIRIIRKSGDGIFITYRIVK